VQDFAQWVQYVNFDVSAPCRPQERERAREALERSVLGVGNEAWGCGGNMTAEYYANVYRRLRHSSPVPRDPALSGGLPRVRFRRLPLDGSVDA